MFSIEIKDEREAPWKRSDLKFSCSIFSIFRYVYLSILNPIKAGGSESMYSLGKKALENSYSGEMHVYSPVFQGQLIEKKGVLIVVLITTY